MSFPMRQLTPTNFPTLLQEIPDSPPLLNIRGESIDSDNKFLCVVGSRKYTSYGKDVCTSLIQGLSGQNITIVSGLALGIDSIAHQAALEVGLTTVAIPGSGLGNSVLYPRSNYRLAHQILDAGGSLVSEFPEDHKARPENFPQRNRIMAGLSHAVLVIEAEVRSGTLITARLATEYNRDVLTAPGSIFSGTSAGPHLLIRLGATPVRSSKDILEVFNMENEEPSHVYNLKDLSENENRVISYLGTPLVRDELIEKMGLPIHEVNSLLSAMELKSLIIEKMGTIRLRKS